MHDSSLRIRGTGVSSFSTFNLLNQGDKEFGACLTVGFRVQIKCLNGPEVVAGWRDTWSAWALALYLLMVDLSWSHDTKHRAWIN